MKIYLDCCCYNRPFDDQTQERIYLETQIIEGILRACQSGIHELIGSSALSFEISQICDLEKRQQVIRLYSSVTSYENVDDDIESRASEIRSQSNIHTYDSYHIALAERANADVMITTDVKLEKMASRLDLRVRVISPVEFMMDYMYGGATYETSELE
ncbi:MAG: PIN domain-containing protein [Oscillospiraceae bacterium]|nr:PIN domain-containing protein [Oscillospiraceae bacterium]